MIHHGDLFDVLPTLTEASIDACVTDPPYDLTSKKKGGSGTASMNLDSPYGRARIGTGNGSGGFMGKKWDGEGVAFNVETWRAAWRVLKPGAFLLAFGGSRTFHRMTCAIEDAGFEIRDCLSWLYGQGFPKSLNVGDGRGTALKPSWEPIILARKPTQGTVAQNVERYGTAALNIDACRIGDGERTYDLTMVAGGFETTGGGCNIKSGEKTVTGRWPANVVLDEEAAAALDEMSVELASGANPTARGSDKFRGIYSDFKGQEQCEPARGLDVGGASRFYYVAKPSREERDFGCETLTMRQRDDSRKEGNPGGDNPRNRGLQPRGNFHPTVKPVELMRWLVRLVTPPGGTVLDPFLGSGTTGMACRYELREFIGIEREADYIQIAERRIAAVAPLFAEPHA